MSGNLKSIIHQSAQLRDTVERDLLAAVLGSPKIAMPAVEEVGLTFTMLMHEDFVVMLETCQRNRNVGRPKLLLACEQALLRHGHWDPSQCSSSESSRWSSISFRRFADSFSKIESPLCATEARLQAHTLIRLFGAGRDAEEHWRHAIKLMEDALSCHQRTR